MRILGIDIGTTSVKAVEIDSAFGRYEIHEYHENPIQPGSSPLETARNLVATLVKKPDRIAAALKSGQVTFRDLQLPTRDKKAIQSTVGFELEDDLPFELDQAVFDYSILSQVGQTTRLHVAATLKKNLEAFLAGLQSVGIDPDLITTE